MEEPKPGRIRFEQATDLDVTFIRSKTALMDDMLEAYGRGYQNPWCIVGRNQYFNWSAHHDSFTRLLDYLGGKDSDPMTLLEEYNARKEKKLKDLRCSE